MRFNEFIKPDTNINFIGYRKIALALSGVAVLISLILIFGMGFNYGIEFSGGIEIRIKVKPEIHAKDIRQALTEKGIERSTVQEYVDLQNVYSIKIKGSQIESGAGAEKSLSDQASDLLKILEARFGKENVENISTDLIGPRVGHSLRQKGLYAILSAMIGILIYIGFRFNFRFAPGAVIALAHDVIITAGVFVFLRHEITLSVIAAFLTIAGYSINDTIIVFDRIREGAKFTQAKKQGEQMPRGMQNALEVSVNNSINQTLSRTILTSATTLIVVVCLYVLGGEILRDFAFAMMIGIGVGTYSSIFIASPFFLMLENAKNNYAAKSKGGKGKGRASKRIKVS